MNFYQGRVIGHDVMDVFATVLNALHGFLTSQRNLIALVKVNRPS